MPKQNRVTPFSTLIETSARGTLMGNRGCLHDEHQRIRRRFQGRRWIICVLEFKGRRHPIMKPGHYTELFFLDEATALAAGHRPCAECQRDRFNRFRDTWAKANPGLTRAARPTAVALDTALHRERTGLGGRPADPARAGRDLPDGTLVAGGEEHAYLVWKGGLLLWTPGGYVLPAAGEDAPRDGFRVLTPPSVVRTLVAGYPVGIHPSAEAPVSRPDLSGLEIPG